MAKKNSTLAWAVGLGTLALAGVGIGLYEKSQKPVTPPGGATATQTPVTTDSGFVDASGNTMDAIVAKAVNLAKLGHGATPAPGKGSEGVYWANLAKAHGPTASQSAMLTNAGY